MNVYELSHTLWLSRMCAKIAQKNANTTCQFNGTSLAFQEFLGYRLVLGFLDFPYSYRLISASSPLHYHYPLSLQKCTPCWPFPTWRTVVSPFVTSHLYSHGNQGWRLDGPLVVLTSLQTRIVRHSAPRIVSRSFYLPLVPMIRNSWFVCLLSYVHLVGHGGWRIHMDVLSCILRLPWGNLTYYLGISSIEVQLRGMQRLGGLY